MPYVATRLGRLFYEERSESNSETAPVVVFLHGFLFDGRQWRHQVPEVARFARVLTFDGPGHGKTAGPGRHFSLEEHADALADAMRALAIERATFVGLSWGGMVALRLALQHPALVSALAILDSSAETEPAIQRAKNLALLALHRAVGVPPSLYTKEVAPLFFTPRTRTERPSLVLESMADMLRFPPEGVFHAGHAVVVRRTSVKARLHEIRVPTLVVCGDLDAATVPEKSRTIARYVHGAELVFIEGAGHMSALEEPEQVNHALLPFLHEVHAH